MLTNLAAAQRSRIESLLRDDIRDLAASLMGASLTAANAVHMGREDDCDLVALCIGKVSQLAALKDMLCRVINQK